MHKSEDILKALKNIEAATSIARLSKMEHEEIARNFTLVIALINDYFKDKEKTKEVNEA